jgi:uncharacterized membrane protein YccC
MDDETRDLRDRLVRLEERVDGHRQVVEGVRLIAEETRATAQRVEVLDEDIGRFREELAAAEDRRRRADREVEARLSIAVERVERACSSLGDRLDTNSNARITSRATIIVGSLSAGAGLVTVLLARLLGG